MAKKAKKLTRSEIAKQGWATRRADLANPAAMLETKQMRKTRCALKASPPPIDSSLSRRRPADGQPDVPSQSMAASQPVPDVLDEILALARKKNGKTAAAIRLIEHVTTERSNAIDDAWEHHKDIRHAMIDQHRNELVGSFIARAEVAEHTHHYGTMVLDMHSVRAVLTVLRNAGFNSRGRALQEVAVSGGEKR